MATTPVTTGVNVSGSSTDGGLNFETLLPQILEKFIQVLEAAVVIIVSIFVIRYARKKFEKIQVEHAEQQSAINLMEKIVTGFLVVMTITIALKTVGIDMTLLVSVAILGLSYGLQDIIKNYVAGILILFKAPFKIGDVVKIRTFTGKVVKMDFQSTMIKTFDNKQVTIYNSDVMTQSITNYTKHNIRRLQVNVTIGYGSDTETALRVFTTILANHEKVLKEPKFSVVFVKFTDMGIVYQLKFWIQRPCNILGIKTEICKLVSQAFDEKNIKMPYGKGVEGENEEALVNIPADRTQRVQSFYGLPLFAAPPAPATVPVQAQEIPTTNPDGTPLTPEQLAQQKAMMEEELHPDWEEPE